MVLDILIPRFKGVEPEPRPSISSGHMPHSISVPFNRLLTKHSFNGDIFTSLLPPSDLRGVLTRSLSTSSVAEGDRILHWILGGQKPVVVSCGSGMTAAIIWLALQVLGTKGNVALYDEVSQLPVH
jgi:thiosulfate/3-mercaptopyruvate sulfurtransferase